jgi:hypothetical protein
MTGGARGGRRAGRAALLALAVLVALSGCAKRVAPPALDAATVRARHDQALARREQVAACALADVDVRLDGRATGRLPRLELRAAIQAPDRLRLRASWLLGTAFDVCALGDTVRAVVPSRHLGLVVGGDASPIGPPGERVLRALLALWRPDEAAWNAAVADSGVLRLRWLDGADSLTMTLDAEGRPATVRWRGPTGPQVRARYLGWQAAGGTDVPARLELADDGGAVRARLDVAEVEPRRAPDPEWFALALPERTERVAWGDLGRWLRGAGTEW